MQDDDCPHSRLYGVLSAAASCVESEREHAELQRQQQKYAQQHYHLHKQRQLLRAQQQQVGRAASGSRGMSRQGSDSGSAMLGRPPGAGAWPGASANAVEGAARAYQAAGQPGSWSTGVADQSLPTGGPAAPALPGAEAGSAAAAAAGMPVAGGQDVGASRGLHAGSGELTGTGQGPVPAGRPLDVGHTRAHGSHNAHCRHCPGQEVGERKAGCRRCGGCAGAGELGLEKRG